MRDVDGSVPAAGPRSERSPDLRREARVALWLTAGVLLLLLTVKPLGGIPWVGTIAFTVAAGVQLYLPIWRAGRLGLDWDFVGLHLRSWRRDLRLSGWLMLWTFPPFVLLHHLYMTEAHGWLVAMGLDEVARWVPVMHLAPRFPPDLAALGVLLSQGLDLAANHLFGVALPEETFYRGYVQARLEHLWPPARRLFGVPLGRAAVVTAALFALGHFVGEWNPMRLGPFFPALLFAWLRNATGSVVGAVTYHAASNVLGAVLFALYR